MSSEAVSDGLVDDVQSSVDGLEVEAGENGIHWISSQTLVQFC